MASTLNVCTIVLGEPRMRGMTVAPTVGGCLGVHEVYDLRAKQNTVG